MAFNKKKSVGALWCSGSCSRLVINGSWVGVPLGAYALRQGILSTIVSTFGTSEKNRFL